MWIKKQLCHEDAWLNVDKKLKEMVHFKEYLFSSNFSSMSLEMFWQSFSKVFKVFWIVWFIVFSTSLQTSSIWLAHLEGYKTPSRKLFVIGYKFIPSYFLGAFPPCFWTRRVHIWRGGGLDGGNTDIDVSLRLDTINYLVY